jgi:hypothetical protein
MIDRIHGELKSRIAIANDSSGGLTPTRQLLGFNVPSGTRIQTPELLPS